MLRITKVSESQSHVTLRIEGQIVSHWVAELERETRRLLKDNRKVVLDFAGVSFVGPQGTEMLKRLSIEDVEIINCSALIRGLLHADGSEGAG